MFGLCSVLQVLVKFSLSILHLQGQPPASWTHSHWLWQFLWLKQSVCGPNAVVFLHPTCQLEKQSYLWRCCFWEITVCFHPLLWWWLWKGKNTDKLLFEKMKVLEKVLPTWSHQALLRKMWGFVSSLGVRSTGQLYIFISVLLMYLRKGLFLSVLEIDSQNLFELILGHCGWPQIASLILHTF